MNSYTAVLNSPIGKLGISTFTDYLTSIDFLPDTFPLQAAIDPIANDVCRQLEAYFYDSSHQFTIPLLEIGTSFQKAVWQNLRLIPIGKTHTYGQLAAQLQTGARALGNACRHNPIPIITPCHRIVGSKQIGGYSGQIAGQLHSIKQWLLMHENVINKEKFTKPA